ncbi:iron complex outermembrane receptor protein [Sphingobium sp. JAI105]|uniref:TonB-dependent receptor n=1 Tax=Sphingobium sp. JAI105 TaxID=2787715 RepID=UPI0018C9BFAA|nr:TonB-dependent receptor [Sphingobium sp. JAI105]MBG6118496.1 iron complex outermembrane receptor protein [Sphingobium sp. JAI105]
MRSALFLSTAACSVMISVSAYAQTPAAPSDAPQSTAASNDAVDASATADIVVTATKRSERLVDVPLAVAAFGENAISQQGITSLNALGRQTPGLTMVVRQNNTPNVAMRGVGAYGAVSGVGFFIDDVITFTDQVARIEDVERIEILKGPQGTLFGGSALGGAIRYVMKTPSLDETSGELSARAGTKNYVNVYGAFNAPLIGDKVALRVSGYHTRDDGFVYDVANDQPSSPIRETGVRGQFLLKPSDALTALLTLKFKDLRTNNAYAPQSDVFSPRYVTNFNFVGKNTFKSYSGVLDLTYDFGSVSLKSITSATVQVPYIRVDLDFSPNPTINAYTTDAYKPHVYTQELRLTSEQNDRFDWIAGLYGQYVKDPIVSSIVPVYIVPFANPFFDYNTKRTDFAAFGTGNYHFGQFTLTGGVRVGRYKSETHQNFLRTVAIGNEYTQKKTFVLPRVALSFKPDNDSSIYASFSQGLNPGGTDATSNPTRPYRAETNTDFEIGAKGYAFDRRLFYDVNLFYLIEKNRQLQTSTNVGGVTVKTTSNIGDSINKGAEVNLNFRATDALTVNAGASYLSAKWRKGARFNSVDISGREVPNSPKWTAVMGATYVQPLNSSLNLNLHADASYSDKFQWDPNYRPVVGTNPSYWIASARIALESADGRWEISGRVDNLFDEKYFTEFFPAYYAAPNANGVCPAATPLCNVGAMGERRRFVVAVSTKF